jgi:DegV family protein with EDD domain
MAYIPTLKYLVRGGRLSAAAGVVGSVLNIYPLISVRDGVVKNEGKARGKNAAYREIAKVIEAEGFEKEYGVVFGHAAAPGDVEEYKDALSGLFEGCESSECEIGAVIGVHTGPGCIGVAYIKANK